MMEFYVKDVLKDIPESVCVVAATKYFDSSEMKELYKEGITHFGENRVEPFLEKIEQLEDFDITWHIIGTLQTKKVKKIINKIDYLHSLDSIKLAQEINKRRTSPLKCFIQVNISNEDSKHGLEKEDVVDFVNEIKEYENIELIGFMGMAEYTKDEAVISKAFASLNILKEEVKKHCNLVLNELSIGMSNDYMIALHHQATFLRLGSVLFRKEES